ncbi:MAG: hypothetical protein Unbinned4388contig1000_73 [Prokaryotic dsDNA virus sp.]|nr:MAG: hypothetical protein Unbinned4388contig1000_73 [Prokaryotic dsDNA virus sp.]
MVKKTLLLHVPEDRYVKFKEYCIDNGYTMTGLINTFIKTSVSDD